MEFTKQELLAIHCSLNLDMIRDIFSDNHKILYDEFMSVSEKFTPDENNDVSVSKTNALKFACFIPHFIHMRSVNFDVDFVYNFDKCREEGFSETCIRSIKEQILVAVRADLQLFRGLDIHSVTFEDLRRYNIKIGFEPINASYNREKSSIKIDVQLYGTYNRTAWLRDINRATEIVAEELAETKKANKTHNKAKKQNKQKQQANSTKQANKERDRKKKEREEFYKKCGISVKK